MSLRPRRRREERERRELKKRSHLWIPLIPVRVVMVRIEERKAVEEEEGECPGKRIIQGERDDQGGGTIAAVLRAAKVKAVIVIAVMTRAITRCPEYLKERRNDSMARRQWDHQQLLMIGLRYLNHCPYRNTVQM